MTISRRNFLKKSIAAGVAIGAVTSPISAVASAAQQRPRGPKGPRGGFRGPQAKRVLIMTFDGIRVDALQQANTPNLDALIKDGSASMATRDVMPSITLPNYSSHLLGAGPEAHGVVDNSWKIDNHSLPAIVRDEDGYFPSVFSVLKENVPGIKTAFFHDWENLIFPYNPKAFDKTMLVDEPKYPELWDAAFEFIKENADSPQMVFLYTVDTDSKGHQFAWMSPEYIKSLEDCDAQLGKMVENLKAAGLYEDTHIMFISDHGGVGKGHGGCTELEMNVPWVIAGPGIKKGFTITEPNNTVNTAATVLRLFGVRQPLCWTGEVPSSIFDMPEMPEGQPPFDR